MTPTPTKQVTLLITHNPDPDIDQVCQILDNRKKTWRHIQPFAGDKLPNLHEVSQVICFGGPYAAYDQDRFPFLREEAQFLRDAVDADIPVLGICLGSQILAEALGGTSRPGDHGLECGFVDVVPVAGQEDVAHQLTGRYFSFHTDSIDLPPGAELLAVSQRYPQAWRQGSALAIQFHPEMSVTGIRELLRIEKVKIRQHGINVENLMAEAENNRALLQQGAEKVIGGWIDHADARAPVHTGESP
ncbi:glutamine amidotransferase (plasmid) [Corynebacterium occultum]|uniref:Glutamine amidotransferase n=1 Tax=Corynebacterium occultum TaxID=2675219 RepID=A0A6B8WR38_9CORY|nr:type 1 glutamine amidotransferase [Corynebacterium occultum]QGU08718.1 glutamine amidotransferase [Corynebacterium occultum]